jgi:hypothetical protein
MSRQVIDLDGREVRVDRLGLLAFLTQPAGELGFVMDIGGPINRPPGQGDHAGPADDVEVRFLLTPGQVAELIVAALNAARQGGDPVVDVLLMALGELGFGPDEEPAT